MQQHANYQGVANIIISSQTHCQRDPLEVAVSRASCRPRDKRFGLTTDWTATMTAHCKAFINAHLLSENQEASL